MEQLPLVKNSKNIRTALFLCFTFYSLDYFFRISQSIIVTHLMQQYHTHTLGIGAFASAFYFGYAIFQLPGGYFLERYSVNRLFAVAIILCSLFYIAFLYAHEFWLGCLLRFFIGATSAISFIGILYLARVYLHAKWFTIIAGVAISIGTLTAAFVQVIGVWLMQLLPWKIALALFGILGIIIGIFLLCVRIEITRENNTNIQIILEHSVTLFKTPVLLMNAIIGSLFYLPTTIFATLWGIPFLKMHFHFSQTQAALGILCLFLGWAIGSPYMGYLATRVKKTQHLITISALLGTLITFALLYLPLNSKLLIFSLLIGFGLASSAQAVIWKIFDIHCPPDINGLGIAWTSMIIILSGTLFHLITGYLLSFNIMQSEQQINYSLGLSLIPIAFIMVALTSFTLSGKSENGFMIKNGKQ